MIDKDYLDSLSDETFIAFIHLKYGAKIPIWKRCTKKEYEKFCGKEGERMTLAKRIEYIINGEHYRRVPFYKNGGGILNQVYFFGKKPDGYYYEKCIGYERVLLMGREMIDYCQTRECMKQYFKD